MPAMANANVVALQLEKVRDKVPLLYERDDILLTMIQQRGDVEKVSSRAMRLPLQINPGGKAGSYNADGGDLGRGSGTNYDVATISPVFFRFAVEVTKLVEYATAGRERAMGKLRDALEPGLAPQHRPRGRAPVKAEDLMAKAVQAAESGTKAAGTGRSHGVRRHGRGPGRITAAGRAAVRCRGRPSAAWRRRC